MVVWAGLSNSQSIGYSYTTISKRLKITTLKCLKHLPIPVKTLFPQAFIFFRQLLMQLIGPQREFEFLDLLRQLIDLQHSLNFLKQLIEPQHLVMLLKPFLIQLIVPQKHDFRVLKPLLIQLIKPQKHDFAFSKQLAAHSFRLLTNLENHDFSLSISSTMDSRVLGSTAS